jgi:hypothetical protein
LSALLSHKINGIQPIGNSRGFIGTAPDRKENGQYQAANGDRQKNSLYSLPHKIVVGCKLSVVSVQTSTDQLSLLFQT